MKLKCILAAVLTLAVMAASGCSANQEAAPAPEQEQSSAHEHSFESGKCECGVLQCDIEGHKMSKATCTKPSTCEVCGKTEGEALGHTCEIGTCRNCHEKVNYDFYLDICEEILQITDSDNSYDYIEMAVNTTSSSTRQEYLNSAMRVINNVTSKLEGTKREISKYSEFDGVYNAITEVELQAPYNFSGTDNNAMLSHIEDWRDWANAVLDVIEALQDVGDLFK